MTRPALTAVALAALALAAPLRAPAKGWYYPLVFNRAAAAVGDTVRVRTAWTPARYVAPPRPGGALIRVYLVRNEAAGEVRRDDPRLVPIGSIRADLRWRGVLAFRVPAVPPGEYTTALLTPGDFLSSRTDGRRVLRIEPRDY
jgi:hypothetical protein